MGLRSENFAPPNPTILSNPLQKARTVSPSFPHSHKHFQSCKSVRTIFNHNQHIGREIVVVNLHSFSYASLDLCARQVHWAHLEVSKPATTASDKLVALLAFLRLPRYAPRLRDAGYIVPVLPLRFILDVQVS